MSAPQAQLRDPLSALAQSVLSREKFSTEVVEDPPGGRQLLLAENRYFVLCVGSADSAELLIELESFAATQLAKRIAGSPLGAKKWDAYLVLMTAEAAAPDLMSALHELNHNTAGFRRLARANVRPSLVGIESVLRPFLPLPELAPRVLVTDPLQELESELVRQGIEASEALRVVSTFRSTGSIAEA